MNGGDVVRSDGNGGAYFTLSCNKLVDGVKTFVQEKVEIPASQMQIHADGSASFDYLYYDQNDPNFTQKTATIELPHYDATLSAGETYKGFHNTCYWTPAATETLHSSAIPMNSLASRSILYFVRGRLPALMMCN